MKKIFASLLILMMVSSAIFAQDNQEATKDANKTEKTKNSWFKKDNSETSSFKDRKLSFALSISPTWSNYQTSKETVLNDRLGRRLSLNYGFNAEYRYSPTLSVLTGANLVAGGGRMYNFDAIEYNNQSATNLVIPNKTKLRYKTRALQIPLIARYYSPAQGNKKDTKVYSQAGLGLNFTTKARATFINDDANIDIKRRDISEDYGNFDAQLLLGIGVIRHFNSRFDTYSGINFSRGFVDMAQNFGKIRNRAWTLDFGIIF